MHGSLDADAALAVMDLDAQDMPPGAFRDRLRWARRQGNPAWLWPDVAVADWRAALRMLERVVRDRLSGRHPEAVDGDPAAIGLACYTSGIGPLLGCWQEQGLVAATPNIAPILALHLRHNRLRAERMEAAAVAMADRLARCRIPVAILKGAYTAQAYFPEAGTRPASDVDLLVNDRHALAAEQVLHGAGLRLASRGARESSWCASDTPAEPRSLMFVHAADPWSVDLHSSLDLVVAAGAPIAALDVLRPLESARRWTANPEAMVLDQPVLLLHLAVHAGAGLHNLTLLRLVELNLVIEQDVAAGRLCWRSLLAAGEAAGLLGYAYPALALCEKLAPGSVPAFVLERCARAAPAGVRRIVASLTPATAQRIGGTSLAEHFMWSGNWRGRARQLAHDISLPRVSWRASWAIYEKRAWQLIRAVSR